MYQNIARKQTFQLCSRNVPLAHTFASGAIQHLGCRPSLRLMVSSYIRKGGHGGDRSKAGLPTGYCGTGRRGIVAPQQPQRKAAARAKELLEEEAARRRPPTAGGSGPSTVMSSSRPVISCKQCIARLVSLD
jgi:hypothetical protein